MNRRQFLIGAGGTACLVLGAGAWVSSKDIDAAREPWDTATNDFDDPRIHALSYAILAPNPHNQQPWLVELVGQDQIILHPDLTRFLPQTDPPNRQITIGYGAFLELLSQAASAIGMNAQITPFPDGADPENLDSRPIATILLEPSDGSVDPLFKTIGIRRTSRQPFNLGRPINTADLNQLRNSIEGEQLFGATSDPQRVARITGINQKAWSIEMDTPRTHSESTKLTRIGATEVNAQPDGISLSGPLIETISLAGMMSRENLAEKGSFAFKETHAFYAGLIEATPTYAWLTSDANDRFDQLAAGRQWVRVNQQASAMGIGFHPVSQPLQEYPEMQEPFDEIHAELGVELPARVQGLFRLGYGDMPSPSPRWPLTKKLKSNA